MTRPTGQPPDGDDRDEDARDGGWDGDGRDEDARDGGWDGDDRDDEGWNDIPGLPADLDGGSGQRDGEAGGQDPDMVSATADLDAEVDPPALPAAHLTLGDLEARLDLRWPETRIEPTLSRISALTDLLAQPQQSFPVIQVAGTNGKTSTARMIDALLTRIGLRTGRFTSPHLQRVTERISLDGRPIDDQRYLATYADIEPYIDLVDASSRQQGGVRLSKFEVLTAMAFAAFADAPVDVGIIEVGLGGTWDSTNVVEAKIAVITPIGIDHTEYLGNTLSEIAANKAGIIKSGSVAVIGPQAPEAMQVLLRRTVEVDATVARFGSEFDVLERSFAVGGQRLRLQGLAGVYDDIFLPLAGEHQAANAALALAAVEAFFGAGADKQLDVGAVQDGFAAVASPGRLERVKTSPTILVDAAHNPHGATALAAALAAEFSFSRLVGVLAVMRDKDVRGLLTALADSFDEVVVTVNSSPRSMPAAELAEFATEVFGAERIHVADRMDSAIALAVDLAEQDGGDIAGSGVIITGSVVSAGDGRALAGLAPA